MTEEVKWDPEDYVKVSMEETSDPKEEVPDLTFPSPFPNSDPDFPDVHLFKSLTIGSHAAVPKVCHSGVVAFYNGQFEADESVLEKGEELKDSHVLTLSFYEPPSSSIIESFFYLTAVVASENRMHLNYNVKCAIERPSAEILFATCECSETPAGACVHIMAVLFLLVEFVESGGKHAKSGKNKSLKKKKSHGAIQKPAKEKETPNDFDPRPKKYRNNPGYADHVYNTTINFCHFSGLDIKIKENFPRANVKAAEQDHDYIKSPLSTTALDEIKVEPL